MHLRPWITLLAVLSSAALAWGCGVPGSDADVPGKERLERALGGLAADSMGGRPE